MLPLSGYDKIDRKKSGNNELIKKTRKLGLCFRIRLLFEMSYHLHTLTFTSNFPSLGGNPYCRGLPPAKAWIFEICAMPLYLCQ